ncbi:MAG: hypothetical protein NTW25_02015, partial [Candidatus Kapabacteria bacterium]|nr:hypothetical protein [Candidatus Kapabacteria bacterium]
MLTIDSNTVFLFGGVNKHRDDFQREVWYFDIKQKEWILTLKDTSNSPPEMIWWPMCKISTDTIITYGYDSECCFYHFYFDLKNQKWIKDNRFHNMQPRTGNRFVDINNE